MQLTVTENRVYLGEVVAWTKDALVLEKAAIVRMMIGEESLASVAHHEPGEQFLVRLPGRVTIPHHRIREAVECAW